MNETNFLKIFLAFVILISGIHIYLAENRKCSCLFDEMKPGDMCIIYGIAE